jgi:hypothetical protein
VILLLLLLLATPAWAQQIFKGDSQFVSGSSTFSVPTDAPADGDKLTWHTGNITSWDVSAGSGTVTSVSCGAGILCSTEPITNTGTISTASSEADFLANGALTCGAGTRGKMQIHTTPLQYCDNAATPALQYAAYGNSTGESTAAANDSVALTTDTTGNYVSGVTANQGVLLTGTEGATVGLIDCAAHQILKRNSGDTDWVCGSGAVSGSLPMQWYMMGRTTCGGATTFIGPGKECNATESNVSFTVPMAIHVTGLLCFQEEDTTCTEVCTFRDDAADTTATASSVNAVPANFAGSVAVGAASVVSVKVVDSGATCTDGASRTSVIVTYTID